MNGRWRQSAIAAVVLVAAHCSPQPSLPGAAAGPRYSEPERVTILGYSDHAMEPDVSSDGRILFWNNSNASPPLTDLHWALRIDDTTFDYQGPLVEANAPGVLDATPSMSDDLRLFFVSLRDPGRGTLFWTRLRGSPASLDPASPVPITRPEWQAVQLDPEPVPAAGTPLYFAWHKDRGLLEAALLYGLAPPEMGIGIADWDGTRYVVRDAPDSTLPGVNTGAFREYAPAVSADHREFYFTRWAGPGHLPQIWMAVRGSTAEPFGSPVHMSQLAGFVEAATLTEDGRLYFHKKVGDRFVIMLARRG